MNLLFSFNGRIGRLTYFTASLCAGLVIGILYAIAVGAGSRSSIPAVAANAATTLANRAGGRCCS
jgi:uncharacterized membrane protein YhaH (DUF805 family)